MLRVGSASSVHEDTCLHLIVFGWILCLEASLTRALILCSGVMSLVDMKAEMSPS